MDRSLVVLGGGKMAEAILLGAWESGVIAPDHVTVIDPHDERRSIFEASGARVLPHASEAAEALQAPNVSLMLAIKPQKLTAAAADLPRTGEPPLVISILGGVVQKVITAVMERALGVAPRVVRVMPNTPAQVGLGVSAVNPGPTATEADAAWVTELFDAVGQTVRIDDEGLMDAVSAVSGSGPAYVFRLVEVMAAAGVSAGLDAEQARVLARQTVIGAGELLRRSDRSAQELREAVSSPGGTTLEALRVLDESGLEAAMAEGVRAACARGRVLSEAAAREAGASA